MRKYRCRLKIDAEQGRLSVYARFIVAGYHSNVGGLILT